MTDELKNRLDDFRDEIDSLCENRDDACTKDDLHKAMTFVHHLIYELSSES